MVTESITKSDSEPSASTTEVAAAKKAEKPKKPRKPKPKTEGEATPKAPAAKPKAKKPAKPKAEKPKAEKKPKAAAKAKPKKPKKPAKEEEPKTSYGQSGPKLELAKDDLNEKESAVLTTIRRAKGEISLAEVVERVGFKPAKKANSWTRNSLRRLVRARLVKKAGRGLYKAIDKAA